MLKQLFGRFDIVISLRALFARFASFYAKRRATGAKGYPKAHLLHTFFKFSSI